MAFGFGFNKQKSLSTAEKYVQQGKIQNAIAEYEKVLKADPKDLTVTNTVGDLYSRLGDANKATECFKIVGDAYATQGFTVKAIAMYKKISKLKPSLESVLKLAELYTQQGLFNDARAQYLQVAEEFLKAGELENAVRIFQKILEMDPENTNMRIRLAEVYVRLNKKNEAWQIFSAAAETLRSKGALAGAEEVLQRMLTLDPGNSYALLMQGRNLLEAGDAEAAIESLQKISDLDSNPDGLRDLLKAYFKTGRLSDAGLLAGKLLSVHNDLAAISNFADALMKAGQYENALQVYDQHAERLLAENSEKVLDNLHAIIGHVRENPASLEKLLDLFQKAGETTHVTEVLELLAHASVQAGDLPHARDLYRRLATAEPGNPLHMNNYQQVVSQLGGPSATKLITAEEAAVIVDELEATAPSIHQHYSDAVALAVRSALTDAELFISYNMPAKALGPLMAALPQAPNDLRLNQRLAALHTRAERFAEAAVCCRTLQSIYSEAGYPEEATRYGELAARYEERSGAVHAVAETAPAVKASSELAVAPASTPWPVAEVPAEGAEFSVVADQDSGAAVDLTAPAVEAGDTPGEIDLSSEWDDSITIELDDTPPAAEIEISDAVGEQDEVAAPVAEAAHESKTAGAAKAAAGEADAEKVAEAIEEIRFYLEHGMPEQAATAFEKLQSLTSDQATLDTLQAEIAAAGQGAAAPAEELQVVDSISEFAIDEPAEFAVGEPAEFAIEEAPVVHDASAVVEQNAFEPAPPTFPEPTVAEPTFAEPAFSESGLAEEATVEQISAEPISEEIPPVEAFPVEPAAPEMVAEVPVADAIAAEPSVAESSSIEVPVEEVPVEEAPVEPIPVEQASAEPIAIEEIAAEQTPAEAVSMESSPEPVSAVVIEPTPGVLQEFVSDLESSLGDNFLPATVSQQPDPEIEHGSSEIAVQPDSRIELEPIGSAKPTSFGVPQSEVMGEFVADLEASLGDDFLKGAPVAEAQAADQTVPKVEAPVAAAPAQNSPAIAPTAPPVNTIAAASAAAASSGASGISLQAQAPVVQQSAAAVARPQIPPVPVAPLAAAAPAQLADAGVDLAEMFGELKHDLEAGSSSTDEDPETHYNLGIAFREMGLLDEAIGELQKTCQSVERGHPFGQVMQTYTWLAQCFLDKGVPEAAIRWYEKALAAPGIDEETRTALHYEIGGAYESSGDRKAALKHFMEVYGRNIDYRDVAERIKALKS